MKRILCIVGSRKPAPGLQSRSASREMLRAVAAGIKEAGALVEWLDLRELDIPFFDGRPLPDYGAPDLFKIENAIKTSNVIVFSVPAYCNGPSGVVKNLFDLLGGASYEENNRTFQSCLADRLVGLLVVGADESSAHHAHAALRMQLTALGAWVLPRAMIVGNPRHLRNVDRLLADLKAYGSYLARLEVSYHVKEPASGTEQTGS